MTRRFVCFNIGFLDSSSRLRRLPSPDFRGYFYLTYEVRHGYWQLLVSLGPLIPPRVPNGQRDRGRQPVAWTLVVAWCSGPGLYWWPQMLQDTFWASTGLQPV